MTKWALSLQIQSSYYVESRSYLLPMLLACQNSDDSTLNSYDRDEEQYNLHYNHQKVSMEVICKFFIPSILLLPVYLWPNHRYDKFFHFNINVFYFITFLSVVQANNMIVITLSCLIYRWDDINPYHTKIPS